jgi:uncharacterized spore protein YtfJ
MAVDVQRVIEEARDVVAGRRVYSEPYERNGVTVILASQVGGGGGGGGGEGEDPRTEGRSTNKGWGGGFGMSARPVGAFVVRGEEVSFVPALDVSRIVTGGQIVAVVALLTLRTIVKARARRRRRS